MKKNILPKEVLEYMESSREIENNDDKIIFETIYNKVQDFERAVRIYESGMYEVYGNKIPKDDKPIDQWEKLGKEIIKIHEWLEEWQIRRFTNYIDYATYAMNYIEQNEMVNVISKTQCGIKAVEIL